MNILLFIVDQQRYPPIYETAELRAWRKQNLLTQSRLSSQGVEFSRHYVGATACSPSRATLFTGQYPSLHGVTQTSGAAKEPFDSDMFWLDRNTVPTMGDYFRAAGYRTFYKGKWHISDEDIIIPGTRTPIPSYHPHTGVPDPAKTELYLHADRLDAFGFTGWVGPEPHGQDPHNSGSSAAIGVRGRDEFYAAELVELISKLAQESKSSDQYQPWLIVASFVNPHDIALYGAISASYPLFAFSVDDTIPPVPAPPTINETLLTKPRCQASYRKTYPQALQPIFRNAFYRRLYYQLQKNVDREMGKVFQALQQSSFYQDTIVVFTSDHGELLGAHGDLHQKWYCAYEEALRVPLVFHNPRLFDKHRKINTATSHVDILPTLLGLIGADAEKLRETLRQSFSEVRPFVGRDLSALLRGEGGPADAWDDPVYFMTEDDVTNGQHQVGLLGNPYKSVVQPNALETVITARNVDGCKEYWKYSRYYPNPRSRTQNARELQVPDEYEMYNLTKDPWETTNLAHPAFSTSQTRSIQLHLAELLHDQSVRKRLYPAN
ncbi:sulfatase-like hydrolase/transferase [Brevibacillus sp. B_LB10_24]|uniref:sulfatase-like hydrolase/transferase n=1 Tax=Brevibacillus sp. B_LB10_24 TaxID=3380645 RepID=UPI0038BD82CC